MNYGRSRSEIRTRDGVLDFIMGYLSQQNKKRGRKFQISLEFVFFFHPPHAYFFIKSFFFYGFGMRMKCLWIKVKRSFAVFFFLSLSIETALIYQVSEEKGKRGER